MVPRLPQKRRSTVQPSITIVALLPFSISLTLASQSPSERVHTQRWDGLLLHDVSTLLPPLRNGRDQVNKVGSIMINLKKKEYNSTSGTSPTSGPGRPPPEQTPCLVS
ncbi:hypothetical protein BDP55DRAFT_673002 [Colletotrichum godetiae]|uniref:Uncharacterized protein n=1 Tax=Colletotrichum godetiae TaxID=1209918 RepID=A0AAJ0AH76_9PEZI|nr:uncharacterized protein BDP55DRAFT_673002 [Colletotrichum godetiae]KAK1672388.1 hypothetical protein BDP55DRAFT_673002 [Colletotrichum godetiae]